MRTALKVTVVLLDFFGNKLVEFINDSVEFIVIENIDQLKLVIADLLISVNGRP